MKIIYIISLLALLISSKVNAKQNAEDLTRASECWKTTSQGKVPTKVPWCTFAYRRCLTEKKAADAEEDNLVFYAQESFYCAEIYGATSSVLDLQKKCIAKWDEYCHKETILGFRVRHLRNECRRQHKEKCTTIFPA